MHVVFIEPDILLADTYRAALQQAGHSVAIAHGAQQAIDVLDSGEKTADVIVLELQLATHDGIECLQELRSYPDWQHIPVVIHTMVPAARLEQLALALHQSYGVQACLYKPRTTLRQLLGAIQRAATLQSPNNGAAR